MTVFIIILKKNLLSFYAYECVWHVCMRNMDIPGALQRPEEGILLAGSGR